ncbi:MAG: heme-binding protein [Oligoflexales bacterium]|nr:heme-binding protein [Oligoflexales bacterium]
MCLLKPQNTKSSKYEVLKSAGEFELRRYQPTIVAETTVDSNFDDAGSIGFRRLAKYIFGDNTTKAEIAMTAPVSQAAIGEKIAMTAPVGQSSVDNKFVISFTMPASYTLLSLPQPNNPEVVLRELPGNKVAAITFSGFSSEDLYRTKLAALEKWLQSESLRSTAPPVFARYNPP